MSKGTPSHGKKSGTQKHIPCRRCGKPSYNIQKGICAACGYGKTTKLRSYNWAKTH